jgi:ribonuclease Z
MTDDVDAPLTITLLGTGSPLPDPNRAGPATLVSGGGEHHLVDCGRGVLMRLAAAFVPVGTLTSVLLTHLHSDHVTDLGDVITTRWIMSFGPTAPLVVVGPVGTRDVVDRILGSLHHDIGYRLAHHDDLHEAPQVDVREVGPGPIDLGTAVSIRAGATDHRPVEPTLGYRFEFGGASAVLAGDTVPCAGLDDLAADADLLVHTVLRKDVIAQIGLPRLLDTMDYHSSPEEAAATATRAGVARLAYTHYVPAFPPGEGEPWRALGAEHFAGPIEVGDDLHRIPVHPRLA